MRSTRPWTVSLAVVMSLALAAGCTTSSDAAGDRGACPAVPTTWVLDGQGRVAARILDQDLAASTLTGVLDEILAEEQSPPA